MKVEKCEFHVSRVSFQGFIIEQWKVKSDPATVQGYSRIAAPLCQLTSTSTLFSWTPEAEAAISQVETPFHMCVCPLASRSFPVSLLCRWMHLTQEWGLSFLSGTLRIRNYTPAPAIPRASLRAECNYDIGNHELLAPGEVVKLPSDLVCSVFGQFTFTLYLPSRLP